MRHRRALLFTLTLASRQVGFVSALFLRRGLVRFANMHHQVFKISRRRLLSLSTRAAFASGTAVHLSQQQQQQQQQQGFESRPSRWISSSSSGGSNFGAGCWRSPQQPALAMSAAAPGAGSGSSSSSSSSSRARSVASGPLRFRGGATTDGENCSCAKEASGCSPLNRLQSDISYYCGEHSNHVVMFFNSGSCRRGVHWHLRVVMPFESLRSP